MSDDRLKLERNRFIVLNAVRIMGAVLILLGLAVVSRGYLNLPREVGYVLLLVGIVEFLAMPLVLANAWRSKPDL